MKIKHIVIIIINTTIIIKIININFIHNSNNVMNIIICIRILIINKNKFIHIEELYQYHLKKIWFVLIHMNKNKSKLVKIKKLLISSIVSYHKIYG